MHRNLESTRKHRLMLSIVVGCSVIVTGFFNASKSEATQTMLQAGFSVTGISAQKDPKWTPMGDSGIQHTKMKISKSCKDYPGIRCVKFNIKVTQDCRGGVYLLANLKDKKGVVVEETSATFNDLRKGDVAKVQMPFSDKTVKNISFTTYSCYPS